MNIQNVIEIKIKEHEFEIEGCLAELDKLKNKGVLKTQLPDSSTIFMLAALKEKMQFHKTAKDVLEDLKKDLNNA